MMPSNGDRQLDSNLEDLRRSHPGLAGQITGKIAPALGRDEKGLPNLALTGGGWLYRDNLESDLKSLPEQILKVRNPQVMLWMGLGLGYHLESYLNRPHPLNQFLVIVEPSVSFFLQFLSLKDRRGLLSHPKVFWMVGIPPERVEHELLEIARVPGFSESIENNLIVEWGYADPYFQHFKKVWNGLVEFTREDSNILPIDAYYGLLNFLDNRKFLPTTPLLQEFKGIFQGQPGIVVSTGPSLSLSLDRLKGVQDKAVIFGVDSALRILKNNQIRPRLTGCLERVPATSKHFRDLDTSQITLFATAIIDPESHKIYQGPKVHVVRSHHFLPWVFPFAEWHDCGISSVSQLGLYCLWAMGCSPIYLVGQDLAFDPVTHWTHAKGYDIAAMGKEDYISIGSKMVRTRSNRGEEIETDAIWYHFGQQTTHMIRQFEIECYNIIPENYGIEIQGVKRLDPEDAFGRCFPRTVDVSGPLNRAFEKFRAGQSKKYQLSFDRVFPSAREALTKLLDDCVRVVHEIYDEYERHQSASSRKDQLRETNAFFRKLEDRALQITKNPVYGRFFYPIVAGRNATLAQRSYALLGEPEEDTETFSAKLCVSLSWFSEAMVRARTILRRLALDEDAHDSKPAARR